MSKIISMREIIAAQPGDVPCPTCGKMRSPNEKCWWCGDPAKAPDPTKVPEYIYREWSYMAEDRDLVYLIGEQPDDPDNGFTPFDMFIREDVDVNDSVNVILSYSSDGTSIRLDPISYGADHEDWLNKMSKDKLEGKDWDLVGVDAYEYYDTYQDYLDAMND